MIGTFKEKGLPEAFCHEMMQEAKALIDSSMTFTAVSMPAVGLSFFMRFLATRDFAHFVHVNIYELSTVGKSEFFRLLYRELGGKNNPKTDQEVIDHCKRLVHELVQKYPKVVIIFNRFDQLKNDFDSSLFSNLRSIREIDRLKLVMIFTASKPLIEMAPERIMGADLYMYSKCIYFKPFTQEDLMAIAKMNGVRANLKSKNAALALSLSGGHHQLFQLLLNTERPEDPLLDRFIKTRLKELYGYLSYHQRKVIQKIALGKSVSQVDEYLLQVGLVVEEAGKFRLFSPLFGDYIKIYVAVRLPSKEYRLYKILMSRLGQVVSKDELFEAVWKDKAYESSDWALNSLIYRLKRHPAFVSSGYILENHKKEGYILYRD